MFPGECVSRTKLLAEGLGRAKEKKKSSQGHLDVQGLVLFSKNKNKRKEKEKKIKIKES